MRHWIGKERKQRRTDENRRHAAKDVKLLKPQAVRRNAANPGHFCESIRKDTLSAIYFSLFFLSISHEINEARILFATPSFFAEMLSNSAIPQAAIA